MSRAFCRAVLLCALLAVLASTRPADATIVIPMPEEDLAAQADAVVVGRVTKLMTHWDPQMGRIFTTITIAVEEVLKGDVTESEVTLTQQGGTLGGLHAWVHGNPEFRRGEKVLVFIDEAPDGTLRVTQLYQGKFSISFDPLVFDELAQRDPNPGGVHTLPAPGGAPSIDSWKLSELKDQVRQWAARQPHRKKLRTRVSVGAATTGGAAAQTFTFLGSPSRWFEPDSGQPVTMLTHRNGEPLVPGGGFAEVRDALAAWSTPAGTSLELRDGGLTSVGGLVYDGVNTISFRDPLGQINPPSGCRGALAIGGYYSSWDQKLVNGQWFWRIVDADLTIADGWQGCGFYENRLNFAEVVTHELGHVLGFGHNTNPDATMSPVAHFDGRGASLKPADVAGLVFVYPGAGGGSTPPPSTSFMLSVSRSGTGTVMSNPAGVTCGTDCSHAFTDGTTVVLTATAPAGAVFTGWSGACTGTGTCSVQITANTSVTANFVAARPDLRVATVSDPPTSTLRGGRFTVTDTVTNGGAANAASSRTRYYLATAATRGSSDIMLSGSRLVAALAAGAQAAGMVTVTVPTSAAGGNYYFLACADDTGVITESDETNNCKAAAGRIVVGQPDLVTSAVSNPPAAARRGTGFSVNDTAKNQGDATGGTSFTRYYLSLDTARDTADRMMIGTRAVDPLAPGATDPGTVNVVIPSTFAPGAYYLLACADDTSRVAESGGSNNCRASATKVQVTQ